MIIQSVNNYVVSFKDILVLVPCELGFGLGADQGEFVELNCSEDDDQTDFQNASQKIVYAQRNLMMKEMILCKFENAKEPIRKWVNGHRSEEGVSRRGRQVA